MARKNRGFTLIELLIVVSIIGILAILAIPAYMKFIAKSRRAEVKYNLEGIYKAETVWYGEYSSFSNSFSAIHWRPEGVCQYTYHLGGTEYYGKDNTVNPQENPLVISASVTGGTFTAKAWGNIDNDPTVDVWIINDRKEGLDNPVVDDLAN